MSRAAQGQKRKEKRKRKKAKETMDLADFLRMANDD